MNSERRDMKRFLIIAVLFSGLTACDRYYFRGMIAPEGETANQRFEQSMEYNAIHGNESVKAGSDNYLLYVFSDTHIDGSTNNLDRFVNAYLSDIQASPFLLCLGDLENGKGGFGTFTSHTAPIADAGRRLFLTAGNHDLYFGRWKDFRSNFNASTYWFEVVAPSAKDLYISLESGGGTLGTSQRAWLENILEEKSGAYRNIIVFTHTHFFMKDFSQGHTSNFALEETYDLADLFSRYGVDLVISGHDHYREDTLFKGVEFLVLDCLEDNADNASYATLSIGDNIKVNFIDIK